MNKRKYIARFRFRGGAVKSLKDLEGETWGERGVLWFYCNGEYIGAGDLHRLGKTGVNTEGVALEKEFRRKGHGLPLYLALIKAAKRIGAKSISSSKRLNKFSRRMWSVKLAKLFPVKSKGVCPRSCRHCRRKARYTITF